LGQYWVWSVTKENWEIVRSKGIWATYDRGVTQRLKKGDVLVFYVKGTSCFKGIFRQASDWYETTEIVWDDEVKEKKLKYPYQIKIEHIQLGDANYRDLIPKLNFVEKKQYPQVYIYGTGGGPVNFRRPIEEHDYKLILEEMRKKPELMAPPPIPPFPTTPDHDVIRDMIHEIGKLEEHISQKEYPIDSMFLNVVWKKILKGNPHYAFEIQIGGNFYQALTKLKHAWDMWRSIPVLVTTEEYEEEAKQLLEGSFHEIRDVIRIINWRKIQRLFELEKEMAGLKDEIGM